MTTVKACFLFFVKAFDAIEMAGRVRGFVKLKRNPLRGVFHPASRPVQHLIFVAPNV